MGLFDKIKDLAGEAENLLQQNQGLIQQAEGLLPGHLRDRVDGFQQQTQGIFAGLGGLGAATGYSNDDSTGNFDPDLQVDPGDNVDDDSSDSDDCDDS